MNFGVLITNHGKHSDEKLAYHVAEQIVTFGDNVASERIAAGRKLTDAIAAVLQDAFAKAAAFDHAEIEAKGTAHLVGGPIFVVAHPEILDSAMSGVMDAIAASPFTGMATESAVRGVVGKGIQDAHHMHRDYFARWGKVGNHTDLAVSDKHNPECEHVKGWIAAAA